METHVCLVASCILFFSYVLVSNPALGDLNYYSSTENKGKGQNISVKCKETRDCLNSTTDSTCNENGWCTCTEDTPVFVKRDDVQHCAKDFNFTLSGCNYKEQCQFSVENSDCKKSNCVCLENRDFDEVSQTCVERESKPLIPIIVGCVLGVIILITLVVYFVRSRGQR